MFHLFIFILMVTSLVVSFILGLGSTNFTIAFIIVAIIALVRYIIERDLVYQQKYIEYALVCQQTEKKDAKTLRVKLVHVFPEPNELLDGFYDMVVMLGDGSDMFLSCNKIEVVETFQKNINREVTIYFEKKFLIEIEFNKTEF